MTEKGRAWYEPTDQFRCHLNDLLDVPLEPMKAALEARESEANLLRLELKGFVLGGPDQPVTRIELARYVEQLLRL